MEMVDAIPRQMETDHDQSEKQLKYLEFVQAAALKAVFCFSNLYDYAKENSGPLKPGVETVEGTVKSVIGPVYHRFHDVPFDLLQFVDRKVDQTVCKLDEQVPPVVKEASTQVISGAHKVASVVQRVGVVETAAEIAKGAYTKCEPVAEELYAKYEPVAEKYAVTAWVALNRLPLFPQVAHIVVPTAAYWSEKYNQAVSYSYGRGYTVASYLPLVPTERIANVFRGGVENSHVEPAQLDETIATSHVKQETFNDSAAAGEVSEGVTQVSK